MKRILVVSVLAIVIAMTGIAWGDSPVHETQHHPTPVTCTVQSLRPFSHQVWDPAKWERGMPSEGVLEAYKRRLECAPPAHKKAMKATWGRDKTVFFKHRAKEKFRVKYTPYHECFTAGCDWAIPTWSVYCESGGGLASENYYGNTQTYYSGMSKKQQDVEAYKMLHTSGYEAAWLQWESGCAGYPG